MIPPIPPAESQQRQRLFSAASDTSDIGAGSVVRPRTAQRAPASGDQKLSRAGYDAGMMQVPQLKSEL